MQKVSALYLKMNEQQWVNRSFTIDEQTMKKIVESLPKILCVFIQNGTNHDYKIHFCHFAEIDFNGSEYFIRFAPQGGQPLARYPGTGIFEETLCEAVIHSDFVLCEERLSEISARSRMMDLPIIQNRQILTRVAGYSEHLAAKDKTIEAQQEELNLHRAALRRDYWIWQDDFDSNHIKSLNCPVLMTAQQLRDLILEASRNSHLALAADE